MAVEDLIKSYGYDQGHWSAFISADPEPAAFLNADPDPGGSKMNADPDP